MSLVDLALFRIKHTTDACPVDPNVQVMYWLEGETAAYVDLACSVAWGLRGEPGRVSHYAVISAA